MVLYSATKTVSVQLFPMKESQLAFFLTMHILVPLTHSNMAMAAFSGHIQVGPKHPMFELSKSILLLIL